METDGIAIAGLLHRVGLSGFYDIESVYYAVGLALDDTHLIHTGSFAQLGTLLVELIERYGLVGGAPGRSGNGLQAGIAAMVDVIDRDAVASHVIPYGIHTTENGGITSLELLVANGGGGPVVVEVGKVEVIVVVACCRYDVCPAVGDADEVITELTG